MYYYGYSGGYNTNPCCPGYGYQMPYQNGYYGYGNNSGAAIILVLFILLVIVIGSRIFQNN